MNKLNIQKKRRTIRIRSFVKGTKERPRLSVFRSNDHMYAQIIDDAMGKTLIGISEKTLDTKDLSKTEKAKALGLALAKLAVSKKITAVVFDKGSYRYHGRVLALAEGAREGGLVF